MVKWLQAMMVGSTGLEEKISRPWHMMSLFLDTKPELLIIYVFGKKISTQN